MKNIIKKGKELSKTEIKLMVDSRLKEYGENDKDFESGENQSVFFFVKDSGKVVSFGMLKPVKITYLGKVYNILGIGNIMSVVNGKGYGKILIGEMIEYLKKKGKTGLGFSGESNELFYEKAGLKVRKKFSQRFALRNPWNGKLLFDDENCAAIYHEGDDRLISKMLKGKGVGTYWIAGMRDPHW
ncbi:MAG: GNAT family N-acetyltransferase [Nanoarchaeota archaeon]|nr:GNAT family N-acetyltransferase [Nanoarchaeota archaeon]